MEPSPDATDVVVLDDVVEAAERLEPHLPRTPVHRLRTDGDGQVWIKAEQGQPTGSFKIRGALFAMLKLSDARALPGVVATSSGNHGRAVAHSAALLGVAAVVVVPHSAPQVKVDALRALEAELVITDPASLDAVAADIRDRRGLALIGCDMPDVIAGQGTVGLELAEQCRELSTVYLPTGTGSLLAGTAVALKGLGRAIRVVGVEPELAADACESYRRGELTAWPVADTYRTVADGLRVPSLGHYAWPLVRRHADAMETVSEAEIVQAARTLAESGRILAEPSGAVACAALLRRRSRDRAPAAAVMSGGNARPDWHRSLLDSR
ncbi:threonine/serine dehydratase [Nonomuraea sp. NPDC051941]|uniref:threonine/serine dehydratase n=1 Tax=Nonomuraea sp. NPDC051941 TaxID=3364373 RepID=UPI0037CBA41B